MRIGEKSLRIITKYSLTSPLLDFMFYRYNITTSLQLVNRFLLMPGALSTAKFAQDGELFARMKLEDDLSVDSVAGRLILQNCNLVWLAPHKESKKQHTPSKVCIGYCIRVKFFRYLAKKKKKKEMLILVIFQPTKLLGTIGIVLFVLCTL